MSGEINKTKSVPIPFIPLQESKEKTSEPKIFKTVEPKTTKEAPPEPKHSAAEVKAAETNRPGSQGHEAETITASDMKSVIGEIAEEVDVAWNDAANKSTIDGISEEDRQLDLNATSDLGNNIWANVTGARIAQTPDFATV